MPIPPVEILNPTGRRRVVVTKPLPGTGWREIMVAADCRIEIARSEEPFSKDELLALIGDRCNAVIGQLTEAWDDSLFAALRAAGAGVYSQYAVGYNNVDLAAATAQRIAVGNTPGVLTDATAELAVALTFAAARRVVESDRFVRDGRFHGWGPSLFLGQLLHGKTLGIVGAGRIGSAYARMMVEGHKMNLLYFNRSPKPALEEQVAAYGAFLVQRGEPPVTCRRVEAIEELLQEADVVSLHTSFTPEARHLLDGPRLARMKPSAILVNTSRGPVIDEAALVNHCQTQPDFRVGLDVYEEEPALQPGLVELPNVVCLPHIASATTWTRQAMARIAACNVVAVLEGWPVAEVADPAPYLTDPPHPSAPSILNARELGLR